MTNWIIGACILLAVLLLLFFLVQNRWMQVTTLEYDNSKIPKAFDGFRVLQVSDLHNTRFGRKQRRLIHQTKLLHPDIILLTGDLIYRRRVNIEAAMEYVRKAVKIAPVYFSLGNHERKIKCWPELKQKLLACGVIVLDNAQRTIQRGGAVISIAGATDPKVHSTVRGKTNADVYRQMEEILAALHPDGTQFTLLLSHRPDLFSLYVKTGCDLVFTGHAHGGLVRLPLIGALYAPDQGLFPKYTSGVHTEHNTTMVISRGLGRSLIPIRVFNRPELILCKLARQSE